MLNKSDNNNGIFNLFLIVFCFVFWGRYFVMAGNPPRHTSSYEVLCCDAVIQLCQFPPDSAEVAAKQQRRSSC